MKKAVIATGGKQYVVSEGETLEVELLGSDDSKVSFEPLLVVEGDNVTVGTPIVDKVKVMAEVVEADAKGDKATSIRYKAKKRVHTVRGHRQRHATIKIGKIA